MKGAVIRHRSVCMCECGVSLTNTYRHTVHLSYEDIGIHKSLISTNSGSKPKPHH